MTCRRVSTLGKRRRGSKTFLIASTWPAQKRQEIAKIVAQLVFASTGSIQRRRRCRHQENGGGGGGRLCGPQKDKTRRARAKRGLFLRQKAVKDESS